jgi:oligopeptide transport system substrate-binding protein
MSSARLAALPLALALATAASAGEKVARMSEETDPPLLDSTRATDVRSTTIVGYLEEGLLRYGPDGYAPGVAESWEVRELGATFHLRPDARWSDGKPVTARDFVFGWRAALDPANASEYAFILYPVKNGEAVNGGKLPGTALGVRAVDDRTLVVEFERPCPYFLLLTAMATYAPVREDFYQAHRGRYGATPQELLYNGPFVLTHWDRGASLTLAKNPLYWDAGRIKLDRIEIPYITSDPNARLDLFADAKIDLIYRIGRDELARSQLERFRMKIFGDGELWYLGFNFRSGHPTRNVHLRRAIRLVYDAREFIASVLGLPGARPSPGLFPHWIPGVSRPFREEYPRPPSRPDLAQARAEVERARAELGGTIPPIVWLTADTPFSQREAEYFQWVLRTRLGLEVRIDRQVWKQQIEKMTAGEFDIFAEAWVADYADPMTYADLFASWNANNRGLYASPRYDALIREAQATADPRRRLDAMAAAERIALDDVAFLDLYESSTVYLEAPRLKGVIRRQVGTDPDLTYADVADEEPPRAWSATR